MNSFAAVLRKDLLLEVRGGQSTVALGALSLLVLVVLVFAFNPGGGEQGAEAAAGALWVALVFSGMLGATRAVSAESENGCIRALLMSPLDRAALYAAKLAAAFIFMAVAEAASIILMVLFFNLEFDARVMRMAPAVLLGALGFAALATLLAAISSRLRGGDLILPLLAVPMFVPALIAGVKASAAALGGAPLGDLHLVKGADRLRRDVRRGRLPALRICRGRGVTMNELPRSQAGARFRNVGADACGALHGFRLRSDRGRPGNRAAYFLFPRALRVGRVRLFRAGGDRGDFLPVARSKGVG